jgi:hypothetical protein
MNKIFFVIITIVFIGCNSSEKKQPSTSIDVGRNFIRATLDGDFVQAETLLLKDSTNAEFFNSYKRLYNNFTPDQKRAYKNSSYNINSLVDVNDSTVLIEYSNTYMNKPNKIKVVRQNLLWNIDFKYTMGDTTTIK